MVALGLAAWGLTLVFHMTAEVVRTSAHPPSIQDVHAIHYIHCANFSFYTTPSYANIDKQANDKRQVNDKPAIPVGSIIM